MRGLFGTALAVSSLLVVSDALTECQMVDLLRSEGIPSQSIAQMTCTAFYASAWNPMAENKNKDGSANYGLFQLSNVRWCYDPTYPGKANGCNAACATLLDASANCAAGAGAASLVVLCRQPVSARQCHPPAADSAGTCDKYDISACGGGSSPGPVPSPSHDSTAGTGGSPSGAGNGTTTSTTWTSHQTTLGPGGTPTTSSTHGGGGGSTTTTGTHGGSTGTSGPSGKQAVQLGKLNLKGRRSQH